MFLQNSVGLYILLIHSTNAQHIATFPNASSKKDFNSNLIKSIRCYLIESGGGSEGEWKDSFKREKVEP